MKRVLIGSLLIVGLATAYEYQNSDVKTITSTTSMNSRLFEKTKRTPDVIRVAPRPQLVDVDAPALDLTPVGLVRRAPACQGPACQGNNCAVNGNCAASGNCQGNDCSVNGGMQSPCGSCGSGPAATGGGPVRQRWSGHRAQGIRALPRLCLRCRGC